MYADNGWGWEEMTLIDGHANKMKELKSVFQRNVAFINMQIVVFGYSMKISKPRN